MAKMVQYTIATLKTKEGTLKLYKYTLADGTMAGGEVEAIWRGKRETLFSSVQYALARDDFRERIDEYTQDI